MTFTVPDVSVHAIGIQVNSTGGGNLVLALDAVNW